MLTDSSNYMTLIWIKILIFYLFYGIIDCVNVERSWREEWYRGMLINHYSFPADQNNTFDLRYLINDKWWDRNGGPIFFYTGNEGEIEYFANATGLMWDWAPEFNAMLVFAEHRYYGHSLPYGALSFKQPYLAHLSIEQVLTDYITIINRIKVTIPGAAHSPVITFGASYGGALSAFLKVKYPDLINGAIASSAPIAQLNNEHAPCWAFTGTTTRTFAEAAAGCDKVIKAVPPTFRKLAETDDGRRLINEKFRLCDDSIIKDQSRIGGLIVYLNQIYPNIAMSDYPYESNLFKPLPPWPVKETCKFLTAPSPNDEAFVSKIQKAANMYFNYTGTINCLSLKSTASGESVNEAYLWAYQMCVELSINNKCNREQDMFQKWDFNETVMSNACFKEFGVRPRWKWLTMNYGLQRIRLAKNIIFTNGYLDAWGSSGVTKEMLRGADPSLVSIMIRQGAHHYDLKSSHAEDTKEIIDVRNQMKGNVQNWINEAKSQTISIEYTITSKPDYPSSTRLSTESTESSAYTPKSKLDVLIFRWNKDT